MASTITTGFAKPGAKKVTFQCKDLVIVKYCDMAFGAKFTQLVNEDPAKVDKAMRIMQARLRIEAAHQEWFDYTLEPYDDAAGKVAMARRLIRDDDDQPVLLVPRAVVVDA